MSATQTSTFGMQHSTGDSSLKQLFDEKFDVDLGDVHTVEWSGWCTGSCLCTNIACDGCSCGC